MTITLIPQSHRVPLCKTKIGGIEYAGYIERSWFDYICRQVASSATSLEDKIDAINAAIDELRSDVDSSQADIDALQAIVISLQAQIDAIASPTVVQAVVDFGASFTDKAQSVITGQTWVTASSVITPAVMCPAGVDTDEMRLLDMRPVISDKVAGVGFTVTLYSEPEARGAYTVSCVGV